MAEYIDREKLCNWCLETGPSYCDNCVMNRKGIPAADVRENVKGRWIHTEDGGYCSECECDMPMYREDWTEWEYCETPFCPNCGAMMGGAEDA